MGKKYFIFKQHIKDIVIIILALLLIVALTILIMQNTSKHDIFTDELQKEKITNSSEIFDISSKAQAEENHDTPKVNEKTVDFSVYEDYTSVTVEQLYYNPEKFDGVYVKLNVWNLCTEYCTPTESENFYSVMIGDDISLYPQNHYIKELVKSYSYYINNIKPYDLPYATAVIYDYSIDSFIKPEREQMTIYGVFSYNPEFLGFENHHKADPYPYQITVQAYK